MLLLFAILAYQRQSGASPSMKYKASPRTNQLLRSGLVLIVGIFAAAAWLEYAEGYRRAMMWGGVAVGSFSIIFGYVWEARLRIDERVDQ